MIDTQKKLKTWIYVNWNLLCLFICLFFHHVIFKKRISFLDGMILEVFIFYFILPNFLNYFLFFWIKKNNKISPIYTKKPHFFTKKISPFCCGKNDKICQEKISGWYPPLVFYSSNCLLSSIQLRLGLGTAVRTN